MNHFHLLLLIGTIVSAKISYLDFSGIGRSVCDGDENCEYLFNDRFQRRDICRVNDNMNQNGRKWCAQGVSVTQNGDYVARVFYEGGYEDFQHCLVVTVIKKPAKYGGTRYSSILVQQPTDVTKEACRAGDIVMTEIDGVYWFLIACTDWIMAFSENSIAYLKRGKRVNKKSFKNFVHRSKVKSIKQDSEMGISLSWISRNQGTLDQFWTGYSMPACVDCEWDVNLKLITIDVYDSWEITNVEEYSMTDDQPVALVTVQGATRVGDHMYFSKTDISSNIIFKCPITGHRVGRCQRLCYLNLPFQDSTYIQGAEVDDDGNLWIGSKFGSGSLFGFILAPWFKLNDLEEAPSREQCLDLPDVSNRRMVMNLFASTPRFHAENEPYNGIEMEPEEPWNQVWSYSTIGLFVLFGAAMFTSAMSVVVYCYNKKPGYIKVNTVSTDEETDTI